MTHVTTGVSFWHLQSKSQRSNISNFVPIDDWWHWQANHGCAGVQHGGGGGDDERGGQERGRRHQLLGVPVHDGRQPRHAVNTEHFLHLSTIISVAQPLTNIDKWQNDSFWCYWCSNIISFVPLPTLPSGKCGINMRVLRVPAGQLSGGEVSMMESPEPGPGDWCITSHSPAPVTAGAAAWGHTPASRMPSGDSVNRRGNVDIIFPCGNVFNLHPPASSGSRVTEGCWLSITASTRWGWH